MVSLIYEIHMMLFGKFTKIMLSADFSDDENAVEIYDLYVRGDSKELYLHIPKSVFL